MDNLQEIYEDRYPALERVLNVFFNPDYSQGRPVQFANAIDFKTHWSALPRETLDELFNTSLPGEDFNDILECAVVDWESTPAFKLAEYFTTIYPALQPIVARYFSYTEDGYLPANIWNCFKWEANKSAIRTYFRANPSAMEEVYKYCNDYEPGGLVAFFGADFDSSNLLRAGTPLVSLADFIKSREQDKRRDEQRNARNGKLFGL